MSPETAAPVIVVGVDGSDGSRDAARWAAGQARLTGARLRGVASWRWPNYVTRIPPGADLAADTSRTLREALADIRAEFGDVEVSEHVVEGPPGPALLSQAGDASLLVVGARGRAAFPGMLLGSVAEYCVRHGPCPVVVVRTSTVPSSTVTSPASGADR
ncbi:MAG TPA: universal stress protein [Streptosporangiaceae bacterium]|jgi:nucleotide-binding universal stress UspA family protein